MQGEKITVKDGVLNVPNNPVIPFIEGDGIGPDIWAASYRVLDAAVEKAYNGERKIVWKEVLAGGQVKPSYEAQGTSIHTLKQGEEIPMGQVSEACGCMWGF